MLHSLVRVIEAHLCQSSGAGAQDRFGAVSFIHRFGATLNRKPMITTAKDSGEGWVDYNWPYPGTDELRAKTS